MAALMRHGAFKIVQFSRIRPKLHAQTRAFATKTKNKDRMNIDKKQPPKIYSTAESIAAKGFLRPQRSYAPPQDVETRLAGVFRKIAGTDNGDSSIVDLAQKFDLCSACAQEFDHSIPNSLLHTMETLNDVKEFYRTPVDTITPLDRMRNMELPENLHVQFEYHRFHPDTDTMFKGQTAFNRSSTLVTGLKYKEKYKGHVQNQQWPFNS